MRHAGYTGWQWTNFIATYIRYLINNNIACNTSKTEEQNKRYLSPFSASVHYVRVLNFLSIRHTGITEWPTTALDNSSLITHIHFVELSTHTQCVIRAMKTMYTVITVKNVGYTRHAGVTRRAHTILKYMIRQWTFIVMLGTMVLRSVRIFIQLLLMRYTCSRTFLSLIVRNSHISS